jgi:hypothetical protein
VILLADREARHISLRGNRAAWKIGDSNCAGLVALVCHVRTGPTVAAMRRGVGPGTRAFRRLERRYLPISERSLVEVSCPVCPNSGAPQV